MRGVERDGVFHGLMLVTLCCASACSSPRLACQDFRPEPLWIRTSEGSSSVRSALPYLTESDRRDISKQKEVAYFSNERGDLLVCFDGGLEAQCGDRHVTYECRDGVCLRDAEVFVVCSAANVPAHNNRLQRTGEG